MKKQYILLIILTLTVALNVSACGKKEKTTILATNMKQETATQEDEIKKIIIDGTNCLNEGKYDDAKSTFEKAISMDKANKGAYIEIKNKYLEKERLDDAYYIIKLAVSNNVDTENMKQLLDDIKSKFEVTKLHKDLYKNNEYSLPARIKVKINDEEKEVDVVWSNSTVDTSKVGEVKYEGKIEQYDRTVELNLKILAIKKEKKIGYITKIYEEKGKRYVSIDEVEFYKNKDANDKTAEIEAEKDGFELEENGIKWNGYYVRNKNNTIKTYEVSHNANIFLCGHWFDLETTTSQKQISFEDFKEFKKDHRYLCYISLENNIVLKIEEQFVP